MARRILIPATSGPASQIAIGEGIAEDPEEILGDLEPSAAEILCQPAVAGLAGRMAQSLEKAGVAAEVYALPDREDAKTLRAVEDAYVRLNDRQLTRGDLIVAVGGGALTDAAGFIAATYLRGLPVTLVPTTLLAAVDAAIGGKTAINVGGKNLVGVFRHPGRVLIDVPVVASAPAEVTREGHAEAVKAGFIADLGLLELYEADGADVDLATVIARAVAVKADVVATDFAEEGRRAVLNYGHTVGHAVEAAAGMAHGEAVAVGMVAAGRASALVCGFEGEARQVSVLEALGLPTGVTGAPAEHVLPFLHLDKKRDRSGTRMVLLEDFGRPVVRSVDGATVRAALEAVGIE